MKRRNDTTLTVVPPAELPQSNRPPPPPDLSPRAADVWRGLVASRASDFFDAGSRELLRVCVSSLVEAERLSAVADALDPVADLDALAKVSRMVDMHRSRASQSLTRLRLTPQSTVDARSGGRAARQGEELREVTPESYFGEAWHQ